MSGNYYEYKVSITRFDESGNFVSSSYAYESNDEDDAYNKAREIANSETGKFVVCVETRCEFI